MKIICALILGVVFTGTFRSHAQEIHDAKKDRAILNKYMATLAKRHDSYFYGMYHSNSLSIIDPSDSNAIKKFFSDDVSRSGDRSVLIARLSDLHQLNNLSEPVLVYGPRSMQRFVAAYVPPNKGVQRGTSPPWLRSTIINSFGFSPYSAAYGRWSMPYTFKSVASNPNSLPFYVTQSNTNKYLLVSER